MTASDLSLLPEELRNKEEEAKRKAKEAMKTPKFDMHMPEKGTNGSVKKPIPEVKEDWVKFGLNGEKKPEKKGIFKIKKKVTPPPSPTPVAPPKPKVDLWAKYCIPAKGLFKKIKQDEIHKDTVTEEYTWLVKSEYWLKVRALLFIVLIIIILFAAGWIGIRSYQLGLLNQYNESVVKLNSANAQIGQFNLEKERIADLKTKIVLVDEVFSNHVYWTNLFGLLEQSTLDNISYIEFKTWGENYVLLTALAPSYSDLAKQVDALERADFAESIDIDMANVYIDEETDDQEVRGVIEIKLKSDVLYK